MSNPVYLAQAFTRGARRTLIEAQAAAEPSYVGTLARRVDSDGDQENHPWIGEAAIMELVEDEIQAAGLTDASYIIVNNTYGIGMAIRRDHMNDDQLGVHMQRVRDMNDIAVNFPNKLIVDAFVNGTSELGYDGVSFYNNAHPDRGDPGSGTQDNLLAGTGTAVADLKTDISSGITTMMRWKAENGEPKRANRSRFAALIPPDLKANMNEAIFASIVANTSNVAFRGMSIEPIADARLADVDDWFLNDISSGAAPVLFQQRENVQLETLGPGSDFYVRERKWWVQVTWRGNVGYSHPGSSTKFVN